MLSTLSSVNKNMTPVYIGESLKSASFLTLQGISQAFLQCLKLSSEMFSPPYTLIEISTLCYINILSSIPALRSILISVIVSFGRICFRSSPSLSSHFNQDSLRESILPLSGIFYKSVIK